MRKLDYLVQRVADAEEAERRANAEASKAQLAAQAATKSVWTETAALGDFIEIKIKSARGGSGE
jgi:hypothetical protein